MKHGDPNERYVLRLVFDAGAILGFVILCFVIGLAMMYLVMAVLR